MRKIRYVLLALIFISTTVLATGRIQNEDVKSLLDLETALATITGDVSFGTNCITNPSSLTGISVGAYIYDLSTPANIPAATTVAGIPGTCSAGQIQMSAAAAGSGVADSISFGGQASQLVNDTKIWVTGGGLNKQLSQAITDGDFSGTITESTLLTNAGISSSVSANALTINLTTATGATPSGGSMVQVAFRNPTDTTGQYSVVNISSGLSITIPAGTTLGTMNGVFSYLYVYLVYNSGTPVLAVSLNGTRDNGSTQAINAISGGSDPYNLYGASGLLNQPIRLLGRLLVQEATAGQWASGAQELALNPMNLYSPHSEVQVTTGNGYGAVNTSVRRFGSVKRNVGADILFIDSSGAGDSFTVQSPGVYTVTYSDSATSGSAGTMAITVNGTALSSNPPLTFAQGQRAVWTEGTVGLVNTISWTGFLNPQDVVRAQAVNMNDASDNCAFSIIKVTN